MIFVLDLGAIVQNIGLSQEHGRKHSLENTSAQESRCDDYLIFSVERWGRCAVKLADVHRLEMLYAENVLFSGKNALIQYGDHSLPLLNYNDYANQFTEDSELQLPLIVFYLQGHAYGLVSKNIFGIISVSEHEIELKSFDSSFKGLLSHQHKYFNLLDLDSLLKPREREPQINSNSVVEEYKKAA